MAQLTIRNELLTNLGGNRIRISADVDVRPSGTESRLEIPNQLWIRVYERDDGRDATHLFADWNSADAVLEANDRRTGWIFIGTFVGNATADVNTEVDISGLVESGAEEIYVVAASRPDIGASVTFSKEFRRTDDPGTFFPITEV